MTCRSFLVRFNESFIKSTSHLLNEDDLQMLSVILSDDPFSNDAHGDIENLYRLEWICDGDNAEGRYWIWYVADINVPYIEVIAITTQKDDKVHDSDRERNRWIGSSISILIRLMRAFYKAYMNSSSDDSDGPDMIDFGF